MRAFLNALAATIIAVSALALGIEAQRDTSSLPAELRTSIDKAVTETLAKTGAPSASIAVVRDATLAYAHAYGSARLDLRVPATTGMRYSIGSISKQFTSTALLLLAEEGRLSIDDKVGRWLPDLTRANEVTIRQLLSMTSGYQDYWPQDYVMPSMRTPTTAQEILDQWAKKPLDFEPGTKWQYSNTNYVAAGMIVEKAAGVSLSSFLQSRLFTPMRMTSATDIDLRPLDESDPGRYLRYAIGPVRPAPQEGKGWLFAAGELAMTPTDLARWDIATINQAVLKAASYRDMQTETLLKNGVSSRYGLGVSVGTFEGHRRVSHGGEVSGFTATNEIYPDDRIAIVVCTNLDATSASGIITSRIASLLFHETDPHTDRATAQARAIFDGLQKGTIDRTLFTSNANAYFSEQALADFGSSLGPLGKPASFTLQSDGLRGGMTLRSFSIKFAEKSLRLTTFTLPDGKLEQYQIAVVE
jgi:D-alanyl-D-alanine carboxypeptidase